MQKALLIAEKPSLRRAIESVYKKHQSEVPFEITFMEQRGHLLTLKTPDELDEDMKEWTFDTLPFAPEDHGGWQYKVIKEKKTGNFLTAGERYSAIKRELKSGQYDFVINAGDPDQEGELLIRIVLGAIGTNIPVKRYWSNDMTEIKMLDALKNLRDDDHDPMLTNLYMAAIGRQHSDYRFGMNISRAATLKIGFRAACGRVKTPILSIVCKREDEIKNFVPKTVYGVRVDYDEGFTGQMYDTSVPEDVDDDDTQQADHFIWFDTKAEADAAIAALSSPLTVTDFKSQRSETYAPKLFKLATAQIAAGKFGFTSQKTLDTIQSLYEKGFMSYPRTDCEFLSSGENLDAILKSASSVPSLAPFISSVTKSDIARVRGTKKWVNDKRLTESGHSALVPTTSAPDFSKLSPDEQRIYELVARQFVAIFLPPLVQNRTTLTAETNGKSFKSTGKTLVDAGYTKIFGTKFSDEVIPEHRKGDSLSASNFSKVEKTSTCPKRFSDADLIAVCEAPHKFLEDASLKTLGKKLKIGTPATRASIIEELIQRDKYLERKKIGKSTYVVPTESGEIIYNDLKNLSICKVDMTGEWELKLEDVRSGNLSLSELEQGMMNDVAAMVDEIKNSDIKTSARPGRKSVCTCPSCGGDILEGDKSYFCSNWKTKGCKVSMWRRAGDTPYTHDEVAKLLSGERISKKISWKDKNTGVKKEGTVDMQYDATENRVKFLQHQATPDEIICKCPKCGGNILEGQKGYYCSNWKDKGCKIGMYKKIGESLITKSELKQLLSGEKVTKKIKWKDKNTGDMKERSSEIFYDFDTAKVEFVKREQRDSSYVCPKCGKTLKDDGKVLSCECGFRFWKETCGKTLTDEQVASFFENGTTGIINGLVGKSGKSFSAEIVLKADKSGTEFRFSNAPHAAASSYTCPKCGKKLIRDGKVLKCDCGFRLWTTTCGKELTEKQLESFFTKGTTGGIKGFVGKSGKKFNAEIILKSDKSGTEFKFF